MQMVGEFMEIVWREIDACFSGDFTIRCGLVDAARKDHDKKVRSAAVNALGQIGSKKARAALLEILQGKGKE